MIKSVKVPASVVAVAVGVILLVAGCGPKHDPCESGCVVPMPTASADDPPSQVFPCVETGGKGPCVQLWPGTDDMCHWWLVKTGHVMDASAESLGVWPLKQGEECA